MAYPQENLPGMGTVIGLGAVSALFAVPILRLFFALYFLLWPITVPVTIILLAYHHPEQAIEVGSWVGLIVGGFVALWAVRTLAQVAAVIFTDFIRPHF